MKIRALSYALHVTCVSFLIGFSFADEVTPAAHAISRQSLDLDILEDFQSDVPSGTGSGGSSGRLNKVGGRPHLDCNNHDIAKCVGLLEVLTNQDLGFAATVFELNQMCPILLKGLQCIDNYTRRCLTHSHREYFNKLYAGTIHVIKDLCNTQGKYHKEYIRHAPCMRTVNSEYNQCSEIYHEKTADLNHITDDAATLDDEEKNRNVITLCCSFQEYLQCSERVVYETCGNETASFTKEFLDRMAGPIVQFKCLNYAPGSQICQSAGSSAPPSPTSGAAVVSLLALLALRVALP